MLDILVYLYETYYRPEACPDAKALSQKLAAAGFPEEDISEALDWLGGQAHARPMALAPAPGSFRVYVEQEWAVLDAPAIAFIQFLEAADVLDAGQREVAIELALATGEAPLPLDKFKLIVLLMLWSQGKEPDMLMFDELLLDEEVLPSRLLH